jgi:WD40 repeat protein
MISQLGPKLVTAATAMFAIGSVFLILPTPCSAQDAEPLTILRGHKDDIISLVFSPDGSILFSASRDQTVRSWKIATGQNATTVKEADEFTLCSIALSPDGKTLALSGVGNRIKLRDLASGRSNYLVNNLFRTAAPQVVFSPAGRYLASWGRCVDEIDLWDIETGLHYATLKISEFGALAVAFQADGKTLASIGVKDGLILWDVATGKKIKKLKNRPFYTSAFSPDGKWLGTVNVDDQAIYLWDVATGKLQRTLKIGEFVAGPVSFSPDDRTLASGGKDGRIKLWSVETGQEIVTFKGHTKAVQRLAFSPDGKTLASGSEDNTIMLWDAMKGK